MAGATFRTALRAWLDANWDATPLAHENEAFAQPEPPAPWIIVEHRGDLYQQTSIGTGSPERERWKEAGVVYFHGMAPVGTGAATLAGHLEDLANALRGQRLGAGVEFRAFSIGDGEVADDAGHWWRLTLRAEWERV